MASNADQKIEEMIALWDWLAIHYERCWPETDDAEPSEVIPDSRYFATYIDSNKLTIVACRRCGQRRPARGESDIDSAG